MRWFGLGKRRIQHDPGRQREVLTQVRQQFGPHLRVRPADQATQVTELLLAAGDDGLAVAAQILHHFADAAHAEVAGQAAGLGYAVDRHNYRPLWQAAGSRLRSPLFAQPGGLHPYLHVTAANTVISGQARQMVRVTDPYPLHAHLFEVLDLTVAGWMFGRVLVDVDGATLAHQVIGAARDLRAAMPDEPPLPDPVRQQMRSNSSFDVHDPAASRVLGRFNPGQEMREALLA